MVAPGRSSPQSPRAVADVILAATLPRRSTCSRRSGARRARACSRSSSARPRGRPLELRSGPLQELRRSESTSGWRRDRSHAGARNRLRAVRGRRLQTVAAVAWKGGQPHRRHGQHRARSFPLPGGPAAPAQMDGVTGSAGVQLRVGQPRRGRRHRRPTAVHAMQPHVHAGLPQVPRRAGARSDRGRRFGDAPHRACRRSRSLRRQRCARDGLPRAEPARASRPDPAATE